MDQGAKNAENLSSRLADVAKKFKKEFSGSGIGKGFDLLTGKATAAIVLVGAVLKTAFGALAKIFVSAETQIAKLEAQLQTVKQQGESELKNQKQDNEYFNELKDLANREALSNAEKARAIELVEELKKRYRDLGITVNTATGEISGLDEALAKMSKKQLQQNIQQQKKEISLSSKLFNKQAELAFTEFAKGNPLQGAFLDIMGRMGYVHKDVDSAMNTVSNMDLDQQIAVFEKMIEYARSDEELQKVTKVLSILKEQKKQKETLLKLNKSLADYDKDRIRQEQQKSRETERQEQEKQDDLRRQRDNVQEQGKYNALRKDEDRIKFHQDKMNVNNTAISNLQTANANIQGKRYGDEAERASDKSRILDLKIRLNDKNLSQEMREKINKEITRLETKVYKYDGERAKDNAQVAKNETEIQKKLLENAQLQQKIDELKRRSANYYDSEQQKLQGEIDYQRLILQGRFDEAEALKALNALKQQGLMKDQKQLDLITKRQKTLRQLNAAKDLKAQAEEFIYQNGPKDFNSYFQKQKSDFEKQHGVKLQGQQLGAFYTLQKFQYDKQQLQSIGKPHGLDIRTNELTARGGFAGGAYVPKTEDYTRSILNYQLQINANLQAIKQIANQLNNTAQNGGIIP